MSESPEHPCSNHPQSPRHTVRDAVVRGAAAGLARALLDRLLDLVR
jgi:hypothetical protein